MSFGASVVREERHVDIERDEPGQLPLLELPGVDRLGLQAVRRDRAR
jgi:hypothetical protein